MEPDVCLARTRDLDVLRAAVASEFVPCRMRVVGREQGEGFLLRHHHGDVRLHTLAYGRRIELTVEHLPDFYFAHVPVEGQRVSHVDAAQVVSAGCIAGPGQRLAVSWDTTATTLIVGISRPAMNAALAARRGDGPSSPTRFEPMINPASGWLHLARAFAGFTASPLAGRSSLATAHFEQLLIHGLLDAQPHSLSEPPQTRGLAVTPAALRRAMTFCAEHADAPISVADMAQAARTGVRALQQAFRVHLDTTPLAYLRQVRLERAHQDLLDIAGGRTTGTVTEVALRWGFPHLGRFSTLYKNAYERTPSQELKMSDHRALSLDIQNTHM